MKVREIYEIWHGHTRRALALLNNGTLDAQTLTNVFDRLLDLSIELSDSAVDEYEEYMNG